MSAVREQVVKVKDAAELRGLSESECVERLKGKARFHRLNGELVVNRDDLAAALKAGIMPKANSSTEDRTADAAAFLGVSLDGSTSSQTSTDDKPEPVPDPLAPAPDPAAEARTAKAAAALGIDLSPATSSTTDGKPEQGRQSGAPVTVTADDAASYRLGRPRRWGQV